MKALKGTLKGTRLMKALQGTPKGTRDYRNPKPLRKPRQPSDAYPETSRKAPLKNLKGRLSGSSIRPPTETGLQVVALKLAPHLESGSAKALFRA